MAAAFISMVAAAHRVLRPAALLRPRHHRRRREGLIDPGLDGRGYSSPARLVRVRPSGRRGRARGLRPSRSRSRATCSASSASRARAPSTTAGGALAMNASLARRARAAGSQPSASASSRSSRVALERPRRRVGGRRPDRGLDLAAGDDDRQVARRGRRVERLRRQLAVERPRPGQALDRRAGAPRRSRRARTGRRRASRASRRPARSPSRARCGSRVMSVDERPDLGLGVEVALPRPGPAGDDEQLRVGRRGAGGPPTAPRSRTA